MASSTITDINEINKLDSLDKQILQTLEEDSRQSNANIARKLKTNKTIINYRIERLQKRKIITGFKYIANQVILGKLSFGILLQFRDLTSTQEEILKTKIERINSVSWTARITGKWDMLIIVIEKDIESFITTLQKIVLACEEHIKEYQFYVDYSGTICGHDYLYDNPKDTCVTYESKENITLNETEWAVFNAIKKNPTTSILQIANNLNKTYDTIKSKLQYLKSKKILLRCSPAININLLGYQETLCLLNVSPSQEKLNHLRDFCIQHQNIVRYTNCLGHFNVILTIHHKDNNQLKEILGTLKKEFSNSINAYEIIQNID